MLESAYTCSMCATVEFVQEKETMSLMQQCLLDLIAPPVGVCLWWLFSRGTATALQGGKVSDRTKKRQRIGFFVLLALGYAMMFGMTIYFHFAR
jgi:hypothetical protein